MFHPLPDNIADVIKGHIEGLNSAIAGSEQDIEQLTIRIESETAAIARAKVLRDQWLAILEGSLTVGTVRMKVVIDTADALHAADELVEKLRGIVPNV